MSSSWRQVESQEVLRTYRAVKAKECFAGCVFMHGVRRNAWHSTMVSYWFYGSGLHPTRELAELAAERGRSQGSHLWYVELPAIILKTNSQSLVIIQPSSNSPFADYREQDAHDLSIGALADAVRRGCHAAEIWEQSPPQSAWALPYRMMDSSSNGSGWHLSWHPTGRTYETRDFQLLIRGLQQAIRAGA